MAEHGGNVGGRPTVSIALPVLDEERAIAACLDAIERQTYGGIAEVLVVDGGSHDRTVALASGRPKVRILHNPRRIQAAALNVALQEAEGDVFVRIDGHCVVAPDYVERCVDALERSGASMVGGAMTPVASGALQEAVAAAMASRLGAGPARFHSPSSTAGWADTVYLGAFSVGEGRDVGGYAEDVGVNEDAELAIRLGRRRGVWFDPSIRSTYAPRQSLEAVAVQFYRYGRSRASTTRRHPSTASPRQLVAPALVLGLLSPWRAAVCGAYLAVLGTWSARARQRSPLAALVMPVMHLPWGVGFIIGLVLGPAVSTRAPRR